MVRARIQALADFSYILTPVCVTWAIYSTCLSLGFPICKTFYIIGSR